MNRQGFWLFVSGLLTILFTDSPGNESRFSRVKCLEGGPPQNLEIVSDTFGQIFLEFDSDDLHNYVIESTDSLWPSAWTTVCSVIGDGQRLRWLATWQPIEWVSLTGGEEAPPTIDLPVADKSQLSVTISLPGVSRQQLVQEGALYDLIRIPGCTLTDKVGLPQLPVLAKYISIPPGCTATLQVEGYEEMTLSGYNVFPVQPPLADKPNARQPAFAKHEAFYRTGDAYPEAVAELDIAAVIRGHDLTLVRVYPVSFDPSNGTLIVRKTINLRVSFSSPDPDVREARRRVRSEVFEELVAGVTLNFASAEAGESTSRARGEHALQDEGAEVLIITHPDLADAAAPLALWKRKLGYSVMVVETTDINAAGPTDAEIETYVQDAYDDWTTPPDYLLLIGDADLVPTQYQTEHPGAGPSVDDDYPDGTQIGTDLYYVTVDGNDYFPDIAHGRIAVDTLKEAMVVISKIVEYERTPPPATSFYSNAAVAAYFQDSRPRNGYEDRRFVLTSEEIRDELLTQAYSVSRLYHTWSSVSPTHYNPGWYDSGLAIPNDLLRTSGFMWNAGTSDVTNAINDGVFAILYRDHGASSNLSGADDGWSHPEFENANVASLTNHRQLPVVFSIACETGWFDGETDDFDTRNSECFCETLLRQKGGGAVGVFGATRISYSGHNDEMEKGFCDAIWPNLLAYGGNVGNQTMGQVLNYGKTYYASKYTLDTTTRRAQFEMYHYFGDPTMSMWTVAPDTMAVTHPATYEDGTESLTITVSDDDATVTLFRDGEMIGAGRTAAGEATFDFAPPLDATASIEVTASKQAFRPYEGAIVPPSAYRWSRTFGGDSTDEARCVQQTPDGGFVTVGFTRSFGWSMEYYLIRTDAYGNEVWSESYGGAGNQYVWSVDQTSDGGYIIAGNSGYTYQPYKLRLIKTDADGNTMWDKTFGTVTEGGCVRQTADGGYIVVGRAGGVYLLKTDADGNETWSKKYGGSDDYGSSVRQTADGGYIVVGYTESMGAGGADVYLIKTDGEGGEIWSKTFGGSIRDDGASVQQTRDGGYIVVGTTYSFGDLAGDVYLIKTDSEGEEDWSKTLGGAGWDVGASVWQTRDGGYALAGWSDSFGTGQEDVYLIRTDANGDETWSRVLGGDNEDAGFSVQQTLDGGFIVAGYAKSIGAGAADVYLVKTDREGNATAP